MKHVFKEDLAELASSQRPGSCSMQHFDQFTQHVSIYGLYKTNTRQFGVVAARIKLEYGSL